MFLTVACVDSLTVLTLCVILFLPQLCTLTVVLVIWGVPETDLPWMPTREREGRGGYLRVDILQFWFNHSRSQCGLNSEQWSLIYKDIKRHYCQSTISFILNLTNLLHA